MPVNTSRALAILNVSALVAMMLSMGLGVSGGALLASVRPARRLVLGLIANFVLLPAVTLGLLRLFHADPMIAAGFVILAACPGAPVGPTLTGIARGDVPWSLGMMLILAGLSTVLTPALLGLLLPWIAPGDHSRVDFWEIVQILLVTQLLPLALGQGLRQVAPGWARRLERPVGFLANVLLLALVVAIVVTHFGMLAGIRPRGWLGTGLLLLAGLGLGWSCGGPDDASRRALATTTATRNVALALVIVGSNFAGTPAVTAVVAYGLVCTLGTLGAALLLRRLGASSAERVRPASPD